jgi:hypothetical protein
MSLASALELTNAVIAWADARKATTDAFIADVRRDETFGVRLNRLAEAESRLAKLAKDLPR